MVISVIIVVITICIDAVIGELLMRVRNSFKGTDGSHRSKCCLWLLYTILVCLSSISGTHWPRTLLLTYTRQTLCLTASEAAMLSCFFGQFIWHDGRIECHVPFTLSVLFRTVCAASFYMQYPWSMCASTDLPYLCFQSLEQVPKRSERLEVHCTPLCHW